VKIYLIRHGETTGDLEDRYGGDYDDHLTQRGVEQARVLGESLKDKGVSLILHSPRIRAVETARIVSGIIHAPTVMVDDIRERNAYGVLTGMVKSEARRVFPEEVEKLEKDSFYHGVKGSEDYDSFKKRVINAFESIVSAHKEGVLAIITHGGVIRCFVREVLQLGVVERLGDCAVLELEYGTSGFSLVSLHRASVKGWRPSS